MPPPPYIKSTALRGPMLLVMLVSIALVGGLCFAWISYIARFQAARCPSDTFMTNNQAPGLAVVLELCFAGALMILLCSLLLPVIVRDLDSREASKVRVMRKVSGTAAAVFGISMAYAAPSQLTSQVCLTPGAIYIQDDPFGNLQRRPWSDVSTVTTSCWNRKGWGAEMDLDLRDGKSVYLNSKISGDAWSQYLPKVAKALHGRDFKFDASAMGSVCRVPRAALLRIRP